MLQKLNRASGYTFPGPPIGNLNVAACKALLAERSIPVVSEHCGGDKGRRMLLEVASGKVKIEVVGQHSVDI